VPWATARRNPIITAISRLVRSSTLLALLWASAEAAASTPTLLYNKTILLSWSLDTVQRRPDGTIVSPRVDIERKIYVSTAGRLFVRTTTTAGKGTRTTEMAPEENRTPEGMARQLRFEGRRLVGHREYHSGTGQMTIDFDPNNIGDPPALPGGSQKFDIYSSSPPTKLSVVSSQATRKGASRWTYMRV
jgi:hypothetical protein